MIRAVRNVLDLRILSFDNPYDENAIRQALTVTVPNYYYTKAYRVGAWDGKYTFYNTYSKSFPYGLFHLLPEDLRSRFYIVDNRQKPQFSCGPMELEDIELRPYQRTIIEQAISNENAIISAPCGSGKTEIAASIIRVLAVPTLWLTHRASLLLQTQERLSKRIGEEVGILMGNQESFRRVTVATVQTLYNRIHSSDKEVKKKYLSWMKSNQMLVLDECHHASSPVWFKLARTCPAYYRFGLSATPLFGDNISNYRLMAVTGPEIRVVENKDLVESGISATPIVHRISNTVMKFVSSSSYPLSYKLGIEENRERNDLIVKIARSYAERSYPVLILVTKINHGKRLKEMLSDVPGVEFLHGSTSPEYRDLALKKIDTGEVKIIIATQIFDEGVDAPNVRVLILACAGRSWRELLQRIGRGMRRKVSGENRVYVYDFVDKGDDFLEEHSRHRLRLYKKEGFDIVNLDVDYFDGGRNEKESKCTEPNC